MLAASGDRARWQDRSAPTRRGKTLYREVVDVSNPLGGPFFLKELHREVRSAAVLRFEREIVTTRELAEVHSGIVPVVDFGVPEAGQVSSPWYVMPRAVRSLERADDFRGNVEKVLAAMRNVADALAAAHARGVVHRDLKPANILEMASGKLQLADFGICFLIDREERLTGTNAQTMGTADFVAPELRGGGPIEDIGPPADVYSLGKTMYALLSGGTVFPGEAHRETKWGLDQVVGARAAGHIHGLLDRMVAFNPDDRFANASVAKHNLERAIEALRYDASFEPGFYGVSDTPVGRYRHLALTLGSREPGTRRATLAVAIETAVTQARAHINASRVADPIRAGDLQENDAETAQVAGDYLLGAGAAFIRYEEDDRAIEWVRRVQALLDRPDVGATREQLVLSDAAAFAIVSAGAMAFRNEAYGVVNAVSAAFLQGFHRIVYIVTKGGYANDWIAETLQQSVIAKEVDPWLSDNSMIAAALPAGIAMLSWLSRARQEALEEFANLVTDPFRVQYAWFDSRAFTERGAGWFSEIAVKCRDSQKARSGLEQVIYSPQKGGLKECCARLSPFIERAFRAHYHVQRRDLPLRRLPATAEWFAWIE